MSVAEREADPGAFSEYDLSCLVDDSDDPREVTVFSTAPGDDLTTH